MNHIKYIVLFTLIMIVATVSSQEKVKFCPYDIKELLIDFDTYSNVKDKSNQSELGKLFYYPENQLTQQKIMANSFAKWFKDPGKEMLTIDEYIQKYNQYFKNREIKYDTLLNDRIVRDYSFIGYKIYVIKAIKEVKYTTKTSSTTKRRRAWEIKPETKRSELYFTIASVKQKDKTRNNKIIRITDYPPNYDWFVPQSVEAAVIPLYSYINNENISSDGDFGFRWKISPNYLLTGKNAFNLYFSPGIGTTRHNFSASTDSLIYKIEDIYDYDNFKYDRHVNGYNLKQDIQINYVDIPLDFVFQWYIKSFRISAITGVNFSFKTSASVSKELGSLEYFGEYNFGDEQNPWIVYLRDLPEKYGFSTYDATSYKSLDDISPINIGANLGATFGYSPDKRLDFNLGIYSTFNFTKLTKSSVPEYLSVRDGEIYPLFYSEANTRLNSVGLFISARYNIQAPNVPYSRKIDGKLISRMKSRSDDVMFVSQKIPSRKKKVGISINGINLDGLKSTKYSFTGINTKEAYTKKLKIGPKPNIIKVMIPENNQLLDKVEVTITKQFSYNITREGINPQSNQIKKELVLSGDDLRSMSENNLKLIVTKIPTFNLFYVNTFQTISSPGTQSIKENIYKQVRYGVEGSKMRNEESMLYYSSTSPLYYHEEDSIDVFLQTVAQSIPELSANDFGDIQKALEANNVDLSRRKVNIHMFLVSYETFKQFVESLLIENLLKMPETTNNWENIYITVYTNMDIPQSDIEKFVLVGRDLPVLISNWRFINIKTNN